MTVRILVGDVRARLKDLPDESVHCVVTSPPYWGLRDYGVAGQLGMEATLGEHIATMVEVFRDVRRVLRKDGTLWLNYGDCYATSPNGRKAADIVNDDRTFRDKPFSTIGPIYDPAGGAKGGGRRGNNKGNANDTPSGRICAGGYLKAKDLCMIPNRLAIALQEDGWWVRSEIIWHKPNPMPESIKDRPGTSHEKIWLLSKAERYWYDAAAVRTEAKCDGNWKMPDGWDTGPGGHGSFHREGREKGKPARGRSTYGRHTLGDAMPADEKRRALTPRHEGHINHTGLDETPRGSANLKNVWTIATQAFPDAHFATFPAEIPERCIKAGCPVGGTVLDPFGGAGTTGLVADRLGRHAILIELNPEYAEMARKRIMQDAPMLTSVEVAAA